MRIPRHSSAVTKPDLTAIAASVQKEGDILVGNGVGSNVFNIVAVLGFSAAARPIVVADSVVQIQAPVMLAVSVLLLPFVWTALKLSRLEGGILLAAYGSFFFWLALGA